VRVERVREVAAQEDVRGGQSHGGGGGASRLGQPGSPAGSPVPRVGRSLRPRAARVHELRVRVELQERADEHLFPGKKEMRIGFPRVGYLG
jgi:hypothetical protein